MPRMDITEMAFARVYPLLVTKAEKKGRTRDEVDQVTAWLTGYTPEELAGLAQSDTDVYKRQGDGRGLSKCQGDPVGI